MKLTGYAIALVALAALLPAHGARAAELRSPPRSSLASGPQFAGSSIYWQDDVCVDGCDPADEDCTFAYRRTLRVAPFGQRARPISRSTVPCGNHNAVLLSKRFMTVKQVFASEDSEHTTTYAVTLRAGPRAGPLRTLYSCEPYQRGFAETDYPDESAPVALAGSVVAYKQACPSRQSVIVRDLASGRTMQFAPRGSRIEAIQMAGRWLVVTTDAGFELRDAHTLAVAARVAGTSIGSVRLAAYGTTTYRPASSCRESSMVVSPAEPVARPVAPGVCSSLVPSAAGYLYRTGGRSAYELRLLPKAGGAARTVLRVTAPDTPAGIAVSADRVAFAVRSCDDALIFRTAPLAGFTRVREERCVVRDGGASRVERRTGRMSVSLRCPRGCIGTVRVRVGRRVTASPYFQLGPSPRAQVVRLLVGARTRAALRRGLSPSALRPVALTYDTRDRHHVTALSRPQAVRVLAGGRSRDAILTSHLVIQTASGRRLLEACLERATTVDEKTGLPSDVGEGVDSGACARRAGRLRTAPFDVRTPRELMALRVRAGTSRACRQLAARRWRCPATGRAAGRRVPLRLDARYQRGYGAIWRVGT